MLEFLDKMLRKGESQLRVGRENPQQQHVRTSWVRFGGVNFHNIPQIEWACPIRFMVDPNWKMEAGSESQETHIQRQRESRIAEAIYLRDSDIPANPSVASDALGFYGDDRRVPIVPLDALNEETLPDDGGIPLIKVEETTTQPLTIPPLGPQVNGQPLLHRDEVTGTAVALVALIKSKEPGSQIDLELLIQLLRNPGMLEQLMMEHGLSANQSTIVTSALPQEWSSVPVSIPRPSREFHPVVTGSIPLLVPGPKPTENTWSPSVPFANSMSREVKSMINQIRNSGSQSNESMPVKIKTSVPSSGPSSSKYDVGKVRKLINEYGVPLGADSVKPACSSSPSAATIVMKDSDYYRRLISKHGVTRENPNPQGSLKRIGMSPVESSPQEQRPPCVYFNSPRGCKHGTSCWFRHIKVNMDGASRGVEEQRAKRMKACDGNFGRHT
ncbi:hypothetical protein L6452_44011 [Arctium lappa]|uniref:Uncharacterized protein n=1 Tax=Arctium lappa TaxID=4217 RepID=A0ACB8XEM1_ARCLA|nr:hypothetical protein L6452_44011 [Arctium lappa]